MICHVGEESPPLSALWQIRGGQAQIVTVNTWEWKSQPNGIMGLKTQSHSGICT